MHRICALCGHFNFNRNCLKIHASYFPCFFFFYLSNEKSFIFMVFILVMVQIDIQE